MRTHCPIKFNVDSLSDDEAGERVRQRLERLLLAVHLQRERRPTIRDLRSMLAFLITGDRSCREVHRVVDGDGSWHPADVLYFESAFSGQGSPDLLLDELRTLDPASAPSARLDRFLFFHRYTDVRPMLQAKFMKFRERSEELLRSDDSPADARRQAEWIRRTKRRLYFEGDEQELRKANLPASQELLPYRYLELFIQAVAGRRDAEQLKQDLARGIARSDGVPAQVCERPPNMLALTLSRNEELDFAVVKQFPLAEFRLRWLEDQDPAVECVPDRLILEHVSGRPMLPIGLDLFETLLRIADGYQPGPEELEPLLQELAEFKSQLLLRPSTEAVLVESGEQTHLVRAENGTIRRVESLE